MEEVLEFLKKAGTYYIATDDNGQPRVRPFGTINLFDGGLYIQTGKVKPCYRQMIENPSIELCAFKGGSWLRLQAKAVEDDRREAKVSMLDSYPSLKGMYSADDDNAVVFRLTECKATFSSFTDPERTVCFG